MDVLEPAALFTVWLGLVVAVLAGLTSVLGMDGRPRPLARAWRARHTAVSPAPRTDGAAA